MSKSLIIELDDDYIHMSRLVSINRYGKEVSILFYDVKDKEQIITKKFWTSKGSRQYIDLVIAKLKQEAKALHLP